MPHLILLTVHYPPSTAAGARRPVNLVRAFRARDWTVSVVTTGVTTGRWEVGDHGEAIWRTPIPDLFVRALESAAGPPSTSRRRNPAIEAMRSYVRRQVVAIRCFPDLWRDVRAPFEQAVTDAMKRSAPTLLYSSGPPLTSHRAAASVKRLHPDLPWVAEFRDPWVEPGSTRVQWSGTVLGPRSRGVFRDLLRASSATVAVSQGIADWLAHQGATRTLVTANGIPDRLLEESDPPIRAAQLRYVGEFYLGRDPEPMLASFGRLRRDGKLSPDFRLELIGEVEDSPAGPIRERVALHGLDGVVTLSPRVPHKDALEAIRTAGAVILLATQQPTQIPNKLYEYLGARRPILAMVDSVGESRRLLQELGADRFTLTEQSTSEDWDRTIEALLRETAHPTPPPSDRLVELRASTQLARVVDWCEALLDR